MIKFLIHKPVAVMMSFLAAVILGVITYFTLPVSLLPDISIPEITVQISSCKRDKAKPRVFLSHTLRNGIESDSLENILHYPEYK